MGYAYDESPFAPLRTTTSGTSLPDKDAEIARLRAELDDERFKRAGAESAYELLSIQSASVVRELERTERERDSARAALDKEREEHRNG